jgi:hypothetical protein
MKIVFNTLRFGSWEEVYATTSEELQIVPKIGERVVLSLPFQHVDGRVKDIAHRPKDCIIDIYVENGT